MKPVPGFPRYLISPSGEIYDSEVHRFVKTFVQDDLLCVHLYTANGYLKRWLSVANLVARAYIGKPPYKDGKVAYRDGNKKNRHWTNLFWMTGSLPTPHTADVPWCEYAGTPKKALLAEALSKPVYPYSPERILDALEVAARNGTVVGWRKDRLQRHVQTAESRMLQAQLLEKIKPGTSVKLLGAAYRDGEDWALARFARTEPIGFVKTIYRNSQKRRAPLFGYFVLDFPNWADLLIYYGDTYGTSWVLTEEVR